MQNVETNSQRALQTFLSKNNESTNYLIKVVACLMKTEKHFPQIPMNSLDSFRIIHKPIDHLNK